MTIDIAIIPLETKLPKWADVKQLIVRFAAERDVEALKNLTLVESEGKRVVEGGEVLQPARSYCFVSSVTNTLSIYIGNKDGTECEMEIVDEEGRRFGEVERRQIAQKWRGVKYWMNVSSGPARSESEEKAIGYFCAGVAAAVGGYVSAFEGLLSIEPGMYRPEEFARVVLLTVPPCA